MYSLNYTVGQKLSKFCIFPVHLTLTPERGRIFYNEVVKHTWLLYTCAKFGELWPTNPWERGVINLGAHSAEVEVCARASIRLACFAGTCQILVIIALQMFACLLSGVFDYFETQSIGDTNFSRSSAWSTVSYYTHFISTGDTHQPGKHNQMGILTSADRQHGPLFLITHTKRR